MPGVLHKFYGDKEYKDRYAEVIWDGKQYMVAMYKRTQEHINEEDLVEYRNLKGYSERYAEDCAENWVLGII